MRAQGGNRQGLVGGAPSVLTPGGRPSTPAGNPSGAASRPAGCGRCASGSPFGVIRLTEPGQRRFRLDDGSRAGFRALFSDLLRSRPGRLRRAAVALEVGAFFDRVAVGAEGPRAPETLEVADELAEDRFLVLLLELGFDLGFGFAERLDFLRVHFFDLEDDVAAGRVFDRPFDLAGRGGEDRFADFAGVLFFGHAGLQAAVAATADSEYFLIDFFPARRRSCLCRAPPSPLRRPSLFWRSGCGRRAVGGVVNWVAFASS